MAKKKEDELRNKMRGHTEEFAPIKVEDTANKEAASAGVSGSIGAHVALDGEAGDKSDAAAGDSDANATDGKKKPNHAKHAKDAEVEFPEYMQRSRKMRKTLLIVIIVLVVLVVAVGLLLFLLFHNSTNAANQQTQVYMEEMETVAQGNAEKDAPAVGDKQTYVPNLVELFGKTQEEAIELLQHGAQVAGTTAIDEGAVKQEVKVLLSDEKSDSGAGAPTVYLDLNEDGRVVRTGYSVSTSALGYGSISFTDAVQNEYIIENTLKEVGLEVEQGSAKLPEDKSAYSTYASDGTTLTRENYTFTGTGSVDDDQYKWSSTLTYDYTMANTTGNLSETIRTIYVYIEK